VVTDYVIFRPRDHKMKSASNAAICHWHSRIYESILEIEMQDGIQFYSIKISAVIWKKIVGLVCTALIQVQILAVAWTSSRTISDSFDLKLQ